MGRGSECLGEFFLEAGDDGDIFDDDFSLFFGGGVSSLGLELAAVEVLLLVVGDRRVGVFLLAGESV